MRFENAKFPLELSDGVLETFDSHRQRTRLHREIGGQLFARFSDGHYLVERATCVRGARSRFSFKPDRGAEQAEIEALFMQQLHYVGDWHTHPEDQPTPSGPDRAKMLGIFQQSQHELPFMLMLIVGRDPFPLGLYVATVSSAGIQELGAAQV